MMEKNYLCLFECSWMIYEKKSKLYSWILSVPWSLDTCLHLCDDKNFWRLLEGSRAFKVFKLFDCGGVQEGLIWGCNRKGSNGGSQVYGRPGGNTHYIIVAKQVKRGDEKSRKGNTRCRHTRKVNSKRAVSWIKRTYSVYWNLLREWLFKVM